MKSLEKLLGCEVTSYAVHTKVNNRYMLIYCEYEEEMYPDENLMEEVIKFHLEKIHHILCAQIEGLDYIRLMPYYNYYSHDTKRKESALFTPTDSSYLVKN